MYIVHFDLIIIIAQTKINKNIFKHHALGLDDYLL